MRINKKLVRGIVWLLIFCMLLPLIPVYQVRAEVPYEGKEEVRQIKSGVMGPRNCTIYGESLSVDTNLNIDSTNLLWEIDNCIEVTSYRGINDVFDWPNVGTVMCYFKDNSLYFITHADDRDGKIKVIFKVTQMEYVIQGLLTPHIRQALMATVPDANGKPTDTGFTTYCGTNYQWAQNKYKVYPNAYYKVLESLANSTSINENIKRYSIAALIAVGIESLDLANNLNRDLANPVKVGGTDFNPLLSSVIVKGYDSTTENSSKSHGDLNVVVDDSSAKLMYESLDVTSVLNDSTDFKYSAEDAEGNLIEIGNPFLKLVQAVNEHNQKMKQFDIEQSAESASQSNFKNSYDYYAANLIMYKYGESEQRSSAQEVLGLFPKPYMFKGESNPLSEEEKLRIQCFSSILSNQISNSKIQTVNIPDEQGKLQLVFNSYNTPEIQVPNIGAWSSADLKDQVDDLVSGRYSEYTSVASTNADLALTNCLALAKYNAALMYGLTPDTNNTDSYGIIKKSDFIESVTLNSSYDFSSFALTFKDKDGYYRGIPQMTKLDRIAGTTQAYEAYYNLNVLLMAIAQFAIENSSSGELSPNAQWVKELKGVSVDQVQSSDHYNTFKQNIDKIKKAVNIADTIEFLGVDKSWFTGLSNITETANALRGYADLVINLDVAYEPNEDELMKTFFNLSTGKYADDYITGVALSATYKPMHTNMYDVQSVSFVNDSEWVTRFHYPWGFYRKALFIDTDINAAVDIYIKGRQKGSTRVATLEDLLEPEKDIVLYADDRFYNTDILSEKMDMAYNKIQNTEKSVTEGGVSVMDALRETFDIDVESIVKTGGNTAYSKAIYDGVTHINDTDSKLISMDDKILSKESIEYQLMGYSTEPTDEYAKQYSPLQSFAVVSAIYRDPALYSTVTRQVNNSPAVFVSSPTLYAMFDVDSETFNTVYNYAMLKNLEYVLPLDYKAQLDLTEPLYIDIYGNIITDSGLVVIPAISNATLCDANYNPTTVGFMYLYNNGEFKISGDANNCYEMLTGEFKLDEESNTYRLRNKVFNNVQINLNNLQLNDEGVIQIMYGLALDNCQFAGYLPFAERVHLITEVLRGAPLEFIDKEKEAITKTTSYSKLGIWVASKIEEIIQSFYDAKTRVQILSLPNLAFMDGFDYLILYLYKILFVSLFVLLTYRLYTDAVNGTLGIKSAFSFIVSVTMFLVTTFGVPSLLDISYYQVNKLLLQEEVIDTLMFDVEKQAEGREIGLTGVQAVESESKMYLKVDDLSVPWYSILDDVLVNNTAESINQLYEQEMSGSALADLPRFERVGQNLYIDVNDILSNSTLIFDDETKLLTNVVGDTPYESYVTPYYVILDILVSKINTYNIDNSINSYDTKVMSGGQVKTMGLITPYLTSQEFMENSQDPAGFRNIYDVETTYYEAGSLSSDSLDAVSKSYWYINKEDYTDEAFEALLSKVDIEARHFVTKHRNLLNKISDESFLEVMALAIACEYNNVFRIGNADSIEIYDVDSTDVILMSLAPEQTLTAQTSKSFTRYIYDNGGIFGSVATAFLLFVYVISSILKPVCLGVMIVCLFSSVVVRRLVKKDETKSVEGYLMTLTLICIANVLFSLVFKVSMFLPDLGLSITASALLQIALQVVYNTSLISITRVVLTDWRNAGFEKYYAGAVNILGRLTQLSSNAFKQTVHTTHTDIYTDNMKHSKDRNKYDIDRTTGDSILESMLNNEKERRRHAGKR